jgi:hypothetical protein
MKQALPKHAGNLQLAKMTCICARESERADPNQKSTVRQNNTKHKALQWCGHLLQLDEDTGDWKEVGDDAASHVKVCQSFYKAKRLMKDANVDTSANPVTESI